MSLETFMTFITFLKRFSFQCLGRIQWDHICLWSGMFLSTTCSYFKICIYMCMYLCICNYNILAWWQYRARSHAFI